MTAGGMTPGDIGEHERAMSVRSNRTLVGDAAAEGLAALGLLTRLPIRRSETAGSDASGAIAFPLVGAVLGLIGGVPVVLVGRLEPLASLLALATIAIVTGALHLDGVADTADALLAPDRARAERARKDPAVGLGGAVALVLVIAIEASALAAIATTGGPWLAAAALVVAAVVSRTAAVAATALERSRITPDGFGAWFADRVGPMATGAAAVLAVTISGLVALLAGSAAVALGGLVGVALGIGMAHVIVTWRAQLDGDGLGAVVELTVAAVLVVTAIVVTTPQLA
jgi:adenosylcobinamide-GDP ribazoletransferase